MKLTLQVARRSTRLPGCSYEQTSVLVKAEPSDGDEVIANLAERVLARVSSRKLTPPARISHKDLP
jgi:hypothetical protein